MAETTTLECTTSSTTMPPSESETTHLPQAQDLYLSSDERYDVWRVKVKERPELMRTYAKSKNSLPYSFHNVRNDDDEHDEHGCAGNDPEKPLHECDDDASTTETTNSQESSCPLPLLDGCDIESWRAYQLVRTTHELPILSSVLNIGMGSCLLRRDRQIAMVSSKSLQPWTQLRKKLLTLPSSNSNHASMTAQRIEYASVMHTLHPWFERANVPVILQNCATHWKAMQSCRFESLLRRYGQVQWRISDTHAETLSLHTYQKYLQCEGLVEDAPLAIYDSQFHLDERADILNDYSVPQCFASDVLRTIDVDTANIPFRWILIGPARSGTGLHVDPLGTHAWVTLIEGLKRWILFPPVSLSTDRTLIGMNDDTYPIPSSIWFHLYYDRIVQNDSNATNTNSTTNATTNAVHILQNPGETVFVPAGWPHAVLNLEVSVAITQNYASHYPSWSHLWQCLRAYDDDNNDHADASAEANATSHVPLHVRLEQLVPYSGNNDHNDNNDHENDTTVRSQSPQTNENTLPLPVATVLAKTDSTIGSTKTHDLDSQKEDLSHPCSCSRKVKNGTVSE